MSENTRQFAARGTDLVEQPYPDQHPITRAPRLGRTLLAGAAILGAAAMANYLIARRVEERHPPAGAFVDVDGVRLHYIERGAGTPIVLVHGNRVMADDFAISGVFDLLAREHRVIAFDRPGFGYSERPRDRIWTAEAQAALLREALRQVGVRSPVLVGHSWGALVALAMALDDQRDTAALVLLSGYYVPTPRPDVPLAMLPAIPIVGDVLRYTVSPLVGWLTGPWVFRKTFEPAAVTQSFKERFPLAMTVRPWQIRAIAGDAGLMVPSAASLLDLTANSRSRWSSWRAAATRSPIPRASRGSYTRMFRRARSVWWRARDT